LDSILSQQIIHLPQFEAAGDTYATATFNKPTLSQLAHLLNRLLKFEQPVWRNATALSKFLQQQQHPPKWSKRELDDLSGPHIEALLDALFSQSFGISDAHRHLNQIMSLFWLTRDRIEFESKAWEELACQKLSEDRLQGIHLQTLSPPLDDSGYQTLLKHCHYNDALADGVLEISKSPWEAFSLLQTLSHPLPWSIFQRSDEDPFQAPEVPHLQQFLADWQACQSHLQTQQPQWLSSPLDPHKIQGLCQFFEQFHQDEKTASLLTQRPIRCVILVEGTTEEVLLPVFAKVAGLDLPQNHLLLVSAGGKNQVFLLYKKYAALLNVPIVMLLDQDAEDQLQANQHEIRPQDLGYVLPEGEMEDAYPLSLLIRTINQHFHPHPALTQKTWKAFIEALKEKLPHLVSNMSIKRATTLKYFWKEHQLGEFDKALFAEALAKEIKTQSDLPKTLIDLFKTLKGMFDVH
jgi:hypothetical protein